MATPAAAQADNDQVAMLEKVVAQAIRAGLTRIAVLNSLAAAGAYPQFAPADTVADNTQATLDLKVLLRAVDALRQGKGELVRWRLNDGPVKWGVHKVGGTMGFWPLVAGVLVVTAALSAAAWWLGDTFGAAQKITAEAKRLREQTLRDVLAAAKVAREQGRVSQADALELAVAKAEAIGNAPAPTLLDQIESQLLGYGKIAAEGAGIGLGVLFLMMMWQRRGKSSSKPRRYRSPVTFRKPVSFRSAVY